MLGMFQSEMTKSTESSNRSSASTPSLASTKSEKSNRCNELMTMRRMVGESSTTRNFIRVRGSDVAALEHAPRDLVDDLDRVVGALENPVADLGDSLRGESLHVDGLPGAGCGLRGESAA